MDEPVFLQPIWVPESGLPEPVTQEDREKIDKIQEVEQINALAAAGKKNILSKRKAEQLADEEIRLAQRWRTTPLSDIQARPTHWLWHHRIPLGEISLIAGRGGIGKSLVLCTMVSWITRGTMKGEFFDKPRNVIFVANEDSYEKTVIPRLQVSDADMTRVHKLSIEMPDGADGRLVLPSDCARLAEMVLETEAVAVFLDPMSSNMMDKDRNSPEVRSSYERLRRMAEEANVSVVGNAHTRKGQSQDLLEAIMGSSEIGNVARAALGVMRDPDAEDGSVILSQCKNNYGPSNLTSYTYKVEEVSYWEPLAGVPIAAPVIVWGEKSERHVNDILSEGVQTVSNSDAAECGEWLKGFLTMNPGSQRSKVMVEANKAGYKEHTVKRAAKRIKVISKMSGYPCVSTWSLPNETIQGFG